MSNLSRCNKKKILLVQGDQIVHLRGFGSVDPTGRAVTPTPPSLQARAAACDGWADAPQC
jgi:hypothetical protein